MINTLLHAKDACAKWVEDGKSTSDPVVVDVINEATQLLMQKGHWRNTVKKLAIATYNNTLALPHNVESVLAVNFDYTPSMIHSQFYEFLDGGPGTLVSSNNSSRRMLQDEGDGFPTFWNIGPEGMKLAAFSTDTADIGKTMRIRGINESHEDISPTTPGEVIRVQRWMAGNEGDIDANSLVLSTNEFYRIHSIVREATTSHVTLLAISDRAASEWRMHKLAKYVPDETHPSYRRYRITASGYNDQEYVVMLVKMRYVPLKYDSDVLPIQSLHALRYMCRAIHHFNNDRDEEGVSAQTKALSFLNDYTSNSRPPHNDVNVDVRIGAWGRNANLR